MSARIGRVACVRSVPRVKSASVSRIGRVGQATSWRKGKRRTVRRAIGCTPIAAHSVTDTAEHNQTSRAR
jgi:hypothetical protein